jgi:hypothetical protein
METVLDWVDKNFLNKVKEDGYLLSDQLFAGMTSGQKKKLVKRLGDRGYSVQRVGSTGAVIQRVV